MRTVFVYVTDKRGYPLTSLSAAALLTTQKSTRNIIIFCDGFMPGPTDVLVRQAETHGFGIEYRPINNPYESDASPFAHEHRHITKAALLKFCAINAISKDYDRALYLDADVLLFEDIRLVNFDFEKFPIAAVYDMSPKDGNSGNPDFVERCRTTGRSPHYFNSGVLAINYLKWNQEFLTKYNMFYQIHKERCQYRLSCTVGDQCIWNMVFERNWKRLPLSMNFQSCAMFSERWQYASVRHYGGKSKYIPFRAWRNDQRDIELINKTRALLGLSPVGHLGARFLRRLNVWRNREDNKTVCNAIARVERMYCDEM